MQVNDPKLSNEEQGAGILTLVAIGLDIATANSPLSDAYFVLRKVDVQIDRQPIVDNLPQKSPERRSVRRDR